MIRWSPMTRPLLLAALWLLSGCSVALLTKNAQAQDAPAGLWKLDAGTGMVAHDSSGHGSNGNLMGNAGWAAPGHDEASALNLTGGSGYVEVPKTVVDTSQSFTVSAWVKVHALGGFQTFVSEDGGQISGFFLQLRGGGGFAMTMPGSDTATQEGAIASAALTVQPDTWYYLVGVHDAQKRTVSLYVNGILQQTVRYRTPWQATGNLEIGRGKYGGNPVDFVNGEINDVTLYQGVHLDTAMMAQVAQQMHMLDATLSIDMSRPGPAINPIMYGLMIEDISHSIDGGLYAELIQNRVFKDNPNNPDHWALVPGDGAGTMALDTTQPVPNTALTTSLRLDITSAGTGRGVGVANDGYWGIPVKPNTVYHASLYAKAGAGFSGPLTVAIESNDGARVYASGTIPAITSNWRKYAVTLKTPANAPTSADNRYVVAAHGTGSVWLTQVSLFPPTWDNRPNGTRIDLMQLLNAIHPGFLRMPGGNYLEGNTIAERFEWKNTIGDISQRPGHQDPWGYRSDDGFGLLEYLEWCQDLHMEPLLAVFAGYALRGEHVNPGPDLQPYVQDALDEIEYVTGGTNTKWGAVRAADGHPAPFPLRYVEIGNEDFFDRSGSYDGRFAQFYDAIKAKYPKLLLIATRADVKSRRPDIVDDHFYRAPADFESDVHHYDHYDRSGPKIFDGEYASQEGHPTPDLNSALGDAAWMTGLERNADVVQIASYAPLLVNVNPHASQWGTNLIGFDALRAYASPSYYVQQLFSIDHGDAVVPETLSGGSGLFTVASRASKSGVLYVKLVNASGLAQKATVTITGAGSVDSRGTAIVLSSADPTDTNTIDDPNHVVPVTKQINGLGKNFVYTMPAYSFTTLVLHAK